MKKSLYLIDGSALAYRAYFALIRNPLITARGEPTSAVYGFLSSLFRVLDEFHPSHLLVVFDTAAPTFRHDLYSEYKSTRAKMPDDMADQLPRLKEVLDAMNVARIEQEGLEADDLIGAYATTGAEEGYDVVVVSGDKDFTQLVSDKITMLLPGKSGDDLQRLDREGVKEKMGVYPEQVIDLLAIMGDSSDHVPGIPGVGPKTALPLLEKHGSLEAVLAAAEQIEAKGLRRKVTEGRESAILSKELVTILTDVDIPLGFDDLEIKPWDNERVGELFKTLEFNRFLDRLGDAAASAPEQKSPDFKQDYRELSTLEDLEKLLARARKKGELTFDTETTGLDPLTADLVGLSFCVDEGEAFYLPVAHEGYVGNLPLDKVIALLDPVLSDDSIAKCAQNAKYDYLVMRRAGIITQGIASDPMIVSYVIDPSSRQHGLSHLAEEHLGYKMQPITDLIGSGKKQKSFATVPVDKAVFYSAEDADCTLRIKNILEPKLSELGLESLYRDIEMPLVVVLADMEREGVNIDVPFLKELSQMMESELEAYTAKIYRFAGEEFNINSPQQLSTILFEKIGLKPLRKTGKKTGYSTDQSVLEKLSEEHPLPRLILEFRQFAKLKSTYVDSLPALINKTTGRVHTSYNQTVAATGRLSSSDPNLQNIPIRTEQGAQIRKAFVPRDSDHVLLSADYSQIELRIMAHYANDKTMIESFRQGEDIHARTASEVYSVDLEDVTPDMRRHAKTANFAVIYGVSAFGLSQQSNMNVTESSEFIDTYFKRYPGIRDYMDEHIEFARQNGYVRTLLGRRRYIPDIESSNRTVRQFAERTAINTPIQGTAADMIKLAMIAIHERLASLTSRMILQVHDELVFDVHKPELKEVRDIVRTEMESAVKLKVPLKADMATGNNWLECK
ncbi:MAG: DNA polymerase I [candidate division Zixibacteria bacterium]|nr:DNA polymerase I [candidate division Zixibacteria bacterium]MBU1471104.1 DNA polymerase I [candidate division Zixibacteria bacterium]MBU2624090.1 DNA polymerase I [candidate division Zixibacteria bacterium]